MERLAPLRIRHKTCSPAASRELLHFITISYFDTPNVSQVGRRDTSLPELQLTDISVMPDNQTRSSGARDDPPTLGRPPPEGWYNSLPHTEKQTFNDLTARAVKAEYRGTQDQRDSVKTAMRELWHRNWKEPAPQSLPSTGSQTTQNDAQLGKLTETSKDGSDTAAPSVAVPEIDHSTQDSTTVGTRSGPA
jgi:hypothetical protein